MTDVQVVEQRVSDVVPEKVFGFDVDIKTGPYPHDAPGSHRKALYCLLTPVDADVFHRMTKAGKREILAVTPLTPRGLAALNADPNSAVSENLVRHALAPAVAQAKVVWESAR